MLSQGRRYVSELARDAGLSRPLLYMHLQRLEAAGLVVGSFQARLMAWLAKCFAAAPSDFRLSLKQVAAAPSITATHLKE